jgi:hypothetical protein
MKSGQAAVQGAFLESPVIPLGLRGITGRSVAFVPRGVSGTPHDWANTTEIVFVHHGLSVCRASLRKSCATSGSLDNVSR